MGLIYGNKFIDEEVLEEQVILNEMHFSKKDLQDPKTIDKIIPNIIKIILYFKSRIFFFLLLILNYSP